MRISDWSSDVCSSDLPSDVRRLVASTVDSLGHIDILVNNAGMTSGAIRRDFVTNPIRFWEVTEEQSQKFFEVNAIAPFTIAASLVPEMMRRKWGRIINGPTSLDNRSEEHTSELQSLLRTS